MKAGHCSYPLHGHISIIFSNGLCYRPAEMGQGTGGQPGEQGEELTSECQCCCFAVFHGESLASTETVLDTNCAKLLSLTSQLFRGPLRVIYFISILTHFGPHG